MRQQRLLPFKDRSISSARHVAAGRETEYRIEGNPGLVLVVQAPNRSGFSSRSFRVYCVACSTRFPGTKKIRLGPYPSVTLKEAGMKAAQIRCALDRGEAYAIVTRRRSSASTTDRSFNALILAYLKDHEHLASHSEIARELKKDVVPVLGAFHSSAITASDIDQLAHRVKSRGAPAIARRLIARIKAIYNYALLDAPRLAADFQLTSNPGHVLGRRRRGRSIGVVCRDRVFQDQEIALFWHALEASDMRSGTQIALKILLVTGQRSAELRKARKSDFDLSSKTWTIPSEHSKNRRPHIVPISQLAVSLVEILVGQNSSGAEFVLRRSDEYDMPPGKTMLPTAMRLMLRNHLPTLAPASPHDLRRTFATGARKLGVSREAVRMVLNHSKQDVTSVYDHYDGFAEKKEALKIWSDHLHEVLAD